MITRSKQLLLAATLLSSFAVHAMTLEEMATAQKFVSESQCIYEVVDLDSSLTTPSSSSHVEKLWYKVFLKSGEQASIAFNGPNRRADAEATGMNSLMGCSGLKVESHKSTKVNLD